MRLSSVLLALCVALMTAVGARADTSSGKHLAVTLVAETRTPAAGSQVTLALDTRPQPGWHGYWQNPGDAGFPATLTWTLPKGVSASAPRYPLPGTLLIAGLMNYVYEQPYAPLVTLSIPTGLKAGTRLPIRLHAAYLVCTTSLCVPEQADLSTELVVGDGAIDPASRARFDTWRRALPRPLGSAATWQVANGRATIAVPLPAAVAVRDPYVFPLATGAIDMAAPQAVRRDGDRLLVEVKAGAAAPAAFAGVLRVAPGRGLAFTASRGALPASTGASVWRTALLAFAGALVGGLILNVMPCVFPILSLKALSLARANADERAARHEALAYTAGVVLVCVALGAAILGLRASGSVVGWAFQLQSPHVVAVLLLLSVGIALNLAGLFELPMPRFAGASGTGGAFATGALAAFVATPCTGPFMGAALGAALVLPAAAALAVFAGLGLGLALPFLLIGFVPALRRRLPRPGGWMETFRRILSVPMLLTALALAWVLGRQAGVDALVFALALALVLALALWIAGLRQRRGMASGWVLAIGVIVSLAAVAALPRESVAREATEDTPFSEARLASLRAANRPVFAYFTADWCLTCKVNERVAIDTDRARSAFRRGNVAVLVGDWTDGDPALGRFIEAHNRAGVPLYLYYAPGAAEPRVLPQVLTPGLLEDLASR